MLSSCASLAACCSPTTHRPLSWQYEARLYSAPLSLFKLTNKGSGKVEADAEVTMEKKSRALGSLLALLVLASCVLPSLAAPLSGNSGTKNQESALQHGQRQVANKGVHMMEHVGRIEIEVNDYPGSGANGRHDPKSPGAA